MISPILLKHLCSVWHEAGLMSVSLFCILVTHQGQPCKFTWEESMIPTALWQMPIIGGPKESFVQERLGTKEHFTRTLLLRIQHSIISRKKSHQLEKQGGWTLFKVSPNQFGFYQGVSPKQTLTMRVGLMQTKRDFMGKEGPHQQSEECEQTVPCQSLVTRGSWEDLEVKS